MYIFPPGVTISFCKVISAHNSFDILKAVVYLGKKLRKAVFELSYFFFF